MARGGPPSPHPHPPHHHHQTLAPRLSEDEWEGPVHPSMYPAITELPFERRRRYTEPNGSSHLALVSSLYSNF